MGKRIQWTIESKRNILNYAKEYGNAAAITKFGCSESSFYEWKKDPTVTNTKVKARGFRKKGGGRKVLLSKDVEQMIVAKIIARRKFNLKVRPRTIKKWALHEARSRNITFNASKGWMAKFSARNFVKSKSSNPKPLKVTDEVLDECEKFQWKVLAEESMHDVKWVVNYDETPAYKWNDNQKTLVVDNGDKNKSLNPNGDKNRITITLGAAMNTDTLEVKKPAAFIIFKQKHTPKTENGVLITGKGNVKFSAQEKAWMDRPLLKQYYNQVLIPFLNDLEGHKLLTFDNLDSHIHETAKELLLKKVKDLTILPLPKNASELMQMCDLSLNRSFKSHLRNLQSDWYDDKAEAIVDKGEKVCKFPKITKQRLINWTSKAWASVTDEVIVSGFKKAGLGLAKDGTEDENVAWLRYLEE